MFIASVVFLVKTNEPGELPLKNLQSASLVSSTRTETSLAR